MKHTVERAFQAVLGAASLAEAVGKALKKLLDATGLAALLGEAASELTADTLGDGIQDMATELLGPRGMRQKRPPRPRDGPAIVAAVASPRRSEARSRP